MLLRAVSQLVIGIVEKAEIEVIPRLGAGTDRPHHEMGSDMASMPHAAGDLA